MTRTATSIALSPTNIIPDYSTERSPFFRDIVAGLSTQRKTLPCKYFYDASGSALFENICELEEYYITRVEIGILQEHLPEMAEYIGSAARIVEFGAGAGTKTQMLLAALENPYSYIPIDISASALADCSRRLGALFPKIAVKPVCADYMEDELFERLGLHRPVSIFFPGSTLGNFDPAEAHAFLCRMRRLLADEGALLIGVDLMKDEAILQAAYDDAKGVTAAFNKNLLVRINNELGGTFDTGAFAHRAVINHELMRVEMHLVSLREQQVQICDRSFHFTEGETIHTENSHKYTLASFGVIAKAAGLDIVQSWTDEHKLYSMHLLKSIKSVA